MTVDLRAAIAEIYRQVDAPGWASLTLDGLADVLRDLGWRPSGPVTVTVPPVTGADAERLVAVLVEVEVATARSERPVRVLVG